MILKLLKNKYFLLYLFVYLIFLVLLIENGKISVNEILSIAFIVGILFTIISYFLSKSAIPIFQEKPFQKNEIYMLILLIAYFTLFITFYKHLIFPYGDNNLQRSSLWTGILKVVFIVIIPIMTYKFIYNFNLKDWGIFLKPKDFLSRKNIIILITFSAIIILFQYFASNGAKPIREGVFSGKQLILGLPLNFIWLLLTVGIVEEFFFRTFLQSRISLMLKSEVGGIMFSAMLFGLAHAPGIYLRGAGEIANLGSNPGFLIAVGYSFLVLSVAGFFLSVIWMKTKNFWLIAAIHAMVDLLPGFNKFVELTGIN